MHAKKNLMFIPERIEEANAFEKTLITYLDGEDKKLFREAKTVYKYVSLKIVGETLANVIGKAREECHNAMVKELRFKDILNSTTAKSIIFSKYIKVCETAYEKCKKEKYKPLMVYGEHTKNLPSIVSKFENDKKANPIIATYKSLSTGVPLVQANVMIACDLPYRGYELDQAIARMVRIGQTRTCSFYYLVLDTGDEYNINSRNIDINKLNNEAVSEITGNDVKDYLETDDNNEIDVNEMLSSLNVNYKSLTIDLLEHVKSVINF
jgi:SNF2 family DNA or RNA helicase